MTNVIPAARTALTMEYTTSDVGTILSHVSRRTRSSLRPTGIRSPAHLRIGGVGSIALAENANSDSTPGDQSTVYRRTPSSPQAAKRRRSRENSLRPAARQGPCPRHRFPPQGQATRQRGYAENRIKPHDHPPDVADRKAVGLAQTASRPRKAIRPRGHIGAQTATRQPANDDHYQVNHRSYGPDIGGFFAA